MTTSRRSLYTAALVATSFLSSQAIHAAIIHVPTSTHAMLADSKDSKPVQFSLRNACSSTLELKAGDQTITVEAGKTVKVKIPAGTKVITTTATGHSEAGSVVVEVSSALNGATVAIS
jgi:hypothetical protein